MVDSQSVMEVFRRERGWLTALARPFRRALGPGGVRSCLMVAVWRALGAHDPHKGATFRQSLRRWARWELLRELRRCRSRHVPLDRPPTWRPDDTDLLEHVRERMRHLSPEDRDVLSLRFFDGLSTREMARRMNLAPSSVRRRQADALSRLRPLCGV